MDDEYRRTLDLIEAAVHAVPRATRGAQLLHVAKDYIVDGDMVYARTVLARVEGAYFEEDLPAQVAVDSLLADALAVVVEAFGADFLAVLRPAGVA